MTDLRFLGGFLLLLTLLVVPSPARAEGSGAVTDDEVSWRGPFRLRGQFPLDLPTLDLTPDDARVLGAGEITIETFLAHSNTFELSPGFDQRVIDFAASTYSAGWDFDVDTESTRLSVRADFGIGGRFQLGIEVPVISHQGGFMDSPIESFHDATGMPNGDRELKPQDDLLVDLIAGDQRFTFDEAQLAFGDVSLHAKVAIFRSHSSAVSAIVDVKAPTGDEEALAGSGTWDHGVGIIGSIGRGRNAFHGGIAHYFLGQPDGYPFEIDDRTSVYVAYEFAVDEHWSFGAQVLGATSILVDEDVLDADDARVELSFGARHGSGPFEVTFGFTENLTTNDNNIDLGLFVGGLWTL